MLRLRTVGPLRAMLLAGLALLVPHAPAGAQNRAPVPEGARVSLVFAAGTTFVLGDVIELEYVLANAGATPFTYGIGGDYRGTGFPARYQWSVLDESQTPLPLEPLQNLGGLGGPRTLVPGAEYRERLRLQHYVRLTQPGTFTVRVTHDFSWGATDERPLPVATAEITVTAPTQAQVEERLRALATDETPLRDNELGAIWHQTPYRYVANPTYLPGLEQLAASGQIKAFEGIDRIQTLDGTRSLTRLLSSPNPEVVHGAALFLIRRMPTRVVDGTPRAWRWWPAVEEREIYKALWLEDASEPLLRAGRALMSSTDVQHVRAGAFIIETIGEPEDGALVIGTLEAVMRGLRDRVDPDDNSIIENPGASDALIAALAGLRDRGYRAPRSGGRGVILAQFLEWAEPGAQRRAGWEQTLEAFITQQPPLLRQAALRALPSPPTGRWEELLLGALNDRDYGVVRDACDVAGQSANLRFAEPLANIVRTEHNEWVVGAASEALRKLGAHALAVDAWIERLSDEKLHRQALGFLANKLEHPESLGWGGRTDSPRDARLALREKWRRFFADPQRLATVQAGQPVPVTEDEARDLFGGVFAFTLEGNRRWPSETNPPLRVPSTTDVLPPQ